MEEGWVELLLTGLGIAAAIMAAVFEAGRFGRAWLPARYPDPARPIDRPDRDAVHYRASGALPPWRC